MADAKPIPPEPHVEFGVYLYESGILGAIFEGETQGLERVAIIQSSFQLAEPSKVPSYRNRLPAVDYLTEIGVLEKEGNVYHYKG